MLAHATVAGGRTARTAFALALIIALLCSAFVPLAGVRAAPQAASASEVSTVDATTPLKAVIVVGPTHSSTSRYLGFGESLAQVAESYGMDVRRIFHPRATAERLKEAIQGANLVAYFGHGNGWPSPYAPFQEKTKNGMGLNKVEGGSQNTVEYYGGNWFRNNVTLADNAVVLFGGLCYAEGNGEPGMGIPGWDVARQRVDNFAAAFLHVGAGAVFAYGWQSVNTVLDQLMTTDKTVDEIFMTRGRTTSPSSGFIDWDDRYFDSQRMPGYRNHLDPHHQEGFLRAVSGTMNMTGADFRSGQPPSGGTDPGGSDPGPTNQPPSVPQGITANVQSDGSVVVSWEPSTDDQAGVKYRVFRNGSKIGTKQTATSYTDKPKPGTHSYKVRAIDASGVTSSFSSNAWATVVSTALPLTAPASLAGNHVGGGTVQLSWDASSGGTGTLKYRLFRNGTAIGTKQTARTYTDSVGAGTHSYKVRAIDGAGVKSVFSATVSVTVTLGGEGDLSGPDTVAPLAPSWMSAASLGYRRVELNWGTATDNRAGTLTYQLFRGNRLIKTLTGRSHVDRPKKAGTKTYWVRAVDAAGNKGAWATVKGAAVKGAVE